jgi:biopolymer transport protein ExbB/TolQ
VLLGAGQLYRLAIIATDGTLWTYTPSDVYIDGAPNSSGDEEDSGGCPHPPGPGDFLLAVDRLEAVGAEKVGTYLRDLPPREDVALTIYRATAGSVGKCSMPAEAAATIPLRPLPPGVLIRQVKKGGPADLAGIVPGDVILTLGGQRFAGEISVGPFGALKALLNGIEARFRFEGQYSARVETSIEAQQAIIAFRPGAEVTFRVLRGDGLHDVRLQLARQPFGVLQWTFLGLLLLLVREGLLNTRQSLTSPASDPASYRQFAMISFCFFWLILVLQSYLRADSFSWILDLAGMAALVTVLIFVCSEKPYPRCPSVLLLFPVAFSITYYLWFWHKISPMEEESGYFTVTGVRAKVFGNGGTFLSGDTAVPVLTLLVFLLALLLLYRFWRGFLRPLSPRHRAHRAICQAAMSGNADMLELLLNNEAAETQSGYYGSRFIRLISRLNKDPADNAPERERLSILEEDEEEAATALAPVDWCVTALPVLGFLGTVIGLARSLADIQGLKIGEVTEGELLATILSAFKGVGYAFDTTFLGLASMLVVAGFHTAVRRAASRRFAEAGAVFKGALHLWVTASPAQDLKQATEDRESARAMIEQVLWLHPSQAIGQTRNILFQSLVMFQDLFPPPDQKVRRWLNANAGEGWEYNAFGLSRVVPEGGLLVAEHQGVRWVARLELDSAGGAMEDRQGSPEPVLQPTEVDLPEVVSIYPAGGSDQFTARAVDGNLFSGKLGEQQVLPVPLPPGVAHAGNYRILATALEKQDYLVLSWPTHQGYELYGLRVGSTQIESLGNLGAGLNENQWALHGPSGTVFRLGQEKTQELRWLIQSKQLRLPSTQGTGARDANSPIIWHDESTPTRILPVGEKLLLVATQDGGMFYWDLGRGYFTRLHHDNWWPEGVPLMISGADGWFAVISQQVLRMWQVRPPGVLIPYQGENDRFPVGALNGDDLEKGRVQATASGKYLLALTDPRTLATWWFPKLSIDI